MTTVFKRLNNKGYTVNSGEHKDSWIASHAEFKPIKLWGEINGKLMSTQVGTCHWPLLGDALKHSREE